VTGDEDGVSIRPGAGHAAPVVASVAAPTPAEQQVLAGAGHRHPVDGPGFAPGARDGAAALADPVPIPPALLGGRVSRPGVTWRPKRRGAAFWVPALATFAVIAGVIGVTLWQLNIGLLFSNTTTTGGDTGAHFMMPAFLSQNLLPGLHLTGWDPGWYDGYPIYTFYFVLPDALIALASHVVPYGLAFKWGTVAGSVMLPVTAWACGRLFRLRPPGPAALAAATLPFLFDYTFTIYGGNLFSTMAGEYAYSFSIALAVLFLGLAARGLRTGRHRGWAAVVLALCIVSHIVPAMFAIAGAGVLTLMELLPARYRLHDDGLGPSVGVSRAPGREGVLGRGQAVWWSVSTVAIGVLLSGWWLVPFGFDQPYSTAMGYQNVTTYVTLLFPQADLWALILAGVGVLVAFALRSRFGIMISVLGGISALIVIFDPQGKLYNTRFLPMWFLFVYLLVGWLFSVVAGAVARWWRRERLARWVFDLRQPDAARRRPAPARMVPGSVGGAFLALAGALLVVATPFWVPAHDLPFGITPGANQVRAWANWNYSGYEGKTDYPEYRAVMNLMGLVCRQHGPGRAMWEYNTDLNRFGTPESLMLLPYWTDGCIQSMEGLLFESSTTTPYHFLNQAELSVSPSEPMVGLPYGSLNVPLGVSHLQLLGVRYFMASSPAVKQAAAADPDLRLIASTGPWSTDFGGEQLDTTWQIYEVRDSAVVTPLTHEPAVLTGVGPSQASWLGTTTAPGQVADGPSVTWYNDPARWGVELAAGGPASWPRVSAAGAAGAPAVPVPPTSVSGVTTAADGSVHFHVSRVGTPVLVKVSYFPNWQATGAAGPWRATPNLMVVVPTSHEVALTYGSTSANTLGLCCTVAGAVALLVLALVPTLRRRRGPRQRPGAPHGPPAPPAMAPDVAPLTPAPATTSATTPADPAKNVPDPATGITDC